MIAILQIKSCRCLKGKKIDRLITRLTGQLLDISSALLGSIIKSETENLPQDVFKFNKKRPVV